MTPEVSVVMPVRDGERYIDEAIASVLSQNAAPLEVVVVDDGSTDGSAARAAAHGPTVRLIASPGTGIWPATNAGLETARGSLVAFIDADDRWTAGRLAKQLAVLRSDPHVDVVTGMVSSFHSPELAARARARYQVAVSRAVGHVPGALLMRRAALDRVGLFDPSLELGALIDWWARARARGLRLRVLDDVVLERRIHGANTTHQAKGIAGDYARALKANLDHRRA